MNYEQWLDTYLARIELTYVVAAEHGAFPPAAQIGCLRSIMLLDFELNVLPTLRRQEPYNKGEELNIVKILLNSE